MTETPPTTRVISTVLVANRGEIARRVVRACRDAGLRSVAVFTDHDVDALAPREADAAVRVGSYLDIAEVVAAAVESGADAIHPGYGFLSENAEFARAVVDAGLVFVGPSADVIDLMGRKDRAREVAERAGVPVMPRFDPDAVPADAYPVLVKAAAGGGGKGMHVVRRPEDLGDALATARREAAAAFGDDTLLVEAYVEGGRHVEVQVFGDAHGNVVHLYDRDCSVQRRHQKVVEEAPAPDLDPALRERLLSSSVALCREVGYVGAGTVEFLVSGDPAGVSGDGRQGQTAYFLEMNTRLQVEHPVTEQVTGLDLVRWQLDVAAGRPLPLGQGEIACTGHAVEVRVYAEDPYAGFLPQAGEVLDVEWAGESLLDLDEDESARVGPGDVESRVHAAIEDDDRAVIVSSAYDPMLAKLVGYGFDREAAIEDVLTMIDESYVVGIATNLGWLRRLVDSPAFRGGEIHTAWLDAYEGPLLERPAVPPEALEAVAGLVAERADESAWRPFDRSDGWRLAGGPAPMRIRLVDPTGATHEVEPGAFGPGWTLSGRGPRTWASFQGESWVFEEVDAMRRPSATVAGTADVVSPMPGAVVGLDVAVGDRVSAGQRLGAVEALKMELALQAPHDGVVTHVGAAVGDQVAMGHVVVHVEEDA